MMNVFRITGDLLHLFSILFLLGKLIKSKSCEGISGKTQLLFAITYSARYLDLWDGFQSMLMYVMIFKITYITCYAVIALLIFFSKTYKKSEDAFLTELLLLPSFLMALWFNYSMIPTEIMWAFSIYLESVAILPQFYMIYKKGQVEKSLLYYLVPLGLYRLFYVFNWIYRYYTENHFDPIADSAGFVYVALYIFALLEFCVFMKVEVKDDKHFLKKNIFFISSNDPSSELMKEDKNLDKENLAETA